LRPAHGDAMLAAMDINDPIDDETGAEIAPAPAKERLADQLLDKAYANGIITIFDGATANPDDLRLAKDAADLLVRAKFATFADEGRTEIAITNAGRYWSLNGGYLAYMKEEPAAPSVDGRQRNPEMEALRSEYMKLRLNTFWWSFGLSVAGFLMSIVSVAIALFYGDRLLR
jgi:hypothetical protein